MDTNEYKIKVLYVEDNPLDVDLTLNHFMFEAPEFYFDTVSTGNAFLQKAGEGNYDIFLLDHHLPDTLGIELIKKLSARGNDVPVVMVTGLGDEEIVTQALRLGASDYLPKHGDYLDKLPGILRNVFTESQNRKKIKQRIAFEKIRILYIEHNEMDLEQTVEYFQREAPVIEIMPAKNAEEGWQILSDNPNIDLILCDLRLSGINGVEFQHNLKQKNIDLPFVMITGQGDEESALAALKLGAYDFIPKSKNYMEKLPVVLQNAYYRYKLGKSNIDIQHKYQDLMDSVDEKINSKTIDLIKEIESRKKAEEEIIKSKQLLQDIIDNSPSVIYLCGADGKILMANKKLEKLLNCTRGEMIGHPREKFMPEEIARQHRQNDLLVVKTGKSSITEESNPEDDGMHYYLTQKFPIFDYEGNVEAIGGIATDFTDRKRAEEQLRLNEEKYRMLAENTSDWVYWMDPEGKLHYVSPSCEQITGYSAAEFYKNPELIHSIIIPEDLEVFRNHQANTSNSNNHFTIEFRIKTKRGEIKWINHSCAPVFGPDGKLGGRQSSNREITELKHAREAIIDSEKRYRELFNSNPNPMWVYDLETLQFLEVNKTAELNYGYSRDEFLTLSLKDIRPKEEIDKLIRDIEQDRTDYQRSGEWKHKRKEGTIFDVEITSHMIEFNGRQATLVMAQHITRRKQAEEELRLSEERYSAFVKQSSDAICLFELSHAPIDTQLPVNEQIDLLYKNALIAENNKTFALSHGYTDPNEMNGLKIGQIFPRLAKENVAYLRGFIENGYNVSQVETKELSKDSSVTFFLNSLTGSVENGRLVRIWGAKQDISRIKKAEEEILILNKELENRVEERTRELVMANKELESFSYSVSHDLRAPLRAISGFTNIIKTDYADKFDTEGQEFLHTILSNTRRMGELIDDLLRLSRISKQELSKNVVSMKELFANVFEELTQSAHNKNVNFIMGEIPKANIDSPLMKIAISNLLSNAIKFSSFENQQNIEVGITKINKKTAYFVKDNGVGFNMAYAGKLFDVFQRLHRVDEFEGTGIGLAIVQRIVHKHGGEIWAESEVGKGATFYFTLSEN